MSLTPSAIGARAEAAVAAALVNAGKDVLLPLYGAHYRYDLVFEDEEGFHRVQCKAGRLRREVVEFMTASYTNRERKAYHGEVGFFGVYCHSRSECYLVPVGELPTRSASLRLRGTRNGQAKGIRWASDYLLD